MKVWIIDYIVRNPTDSLEGHVGEFFLEQRISNEYGRNNILRVIYKFSPKMKIYYIFLDFLRNGGKNNR